MGLQPRLSVKTLLDMNPALVRGRMEGIEELAKSMKEHGQLYPLVVREDMLIISGGRRLVAAQLLRWKEVAAIVTDDHDTVLDLMIKEREHDNDPDVDPALKQTPMRWLEAADLIGRVLGPMEVRGRMRNRRNKIRAQYIGGDQGGQGHMTERMTRMHAAVGLDRNHYKAISMFHGALTYAPTPERRAEIRGFIEQSEAQGRGLRYVQRVLAGHITNGRAVSVLPEKRIDDTLKAKIQKEKLEGILSTLKLLGSELESAFSYVSPAIEPAWLSTSWAELNEAEKAFRRVRARMRIAFRNTNEENL